MKKWIAIPAAAVMLFTAKCAVSQNLPIDSSTKLITYKEVVKQDGEPGKTYNLAISWINSFYDNPSEATRLRDQVNNKIEIHHRFKVYNKDNKGVKTDAAVIDYVMFLEFKENRYRYSISNFNVLRVSKFPLERWMNKTDPQYTPVCDDYLKQVDETINGIIKSLKEGLKPKVVKEDNW
ncbi:MAG: DUF4468 domain-containing protein [Bacteroidota bacterium]